MAGRALAGADGIRLILMHSPDGLTALGGEPFAMAFTGHVHGGQFVLPGGRSLIGVKGAAQSALPGRRVVRAWGSGERILLVSRGLGRGRCRCGFGRDPEVHVCDPDL